MSDDELELQRRETQLRNELQRRVVPPAAPASLVRHVAELGRASAIGIEEAPTSMTVRKRGVSPGAGILSGLATAACIVVLLAAGLSWRASHPAAAVLSNSPSNSAVPSAISSSGAVASPTLSPTVSPMPIPTWVGQPVVVTSVGRVDADFGWVVGNTSNTQDGPATLYVTRDGGTTWKTSTPPDLDIDPISLQFVDRDHGAYAVGRKVYVTQDGGMTWTSSTVPAAATLQVGSIDMLDGRLIWAYLGNDAGNGQLWATTDGGATWSLRQRSTSSSLPYFTFVSETEGWGWLGTLVKGKYTNVKSVHTLDGGRTWTSAALPLPADYSEFGQVWEPPVLSGGRLVLSLMADATSAKQAPYYQAFVLVSSDDGGASWNLDSTIPLSAGPPIRVGQSGSLFVQQAPNQNPVGQLTFFSPSGPALTATIDPPATVCKDPTGDGLQTVGGGGQYAVVSTTEAWLSCGTFVGNAPTLDHLYRTTDGGKTWTGLLGAP
jgi:hypothetical protein